MKTRLLFREHGNVIRTTTRGDWLWPLGAVVALVLLFGTAGWLDAGAELAELQALEQQQQRHQAALAHAWELGRQRGQAEMLATAEGAWAAARAEAEHCTLRLVRRSTP